MAQRISRAAPLHRARGQRDLVNPPQALPLLHGDRSADCSHFHAHLQRERPPRNVVRPDRRTVGAVAQVGVALRLHQFLHQRRERLIHQNHPRVLVGAAVRLERRRCLVHLDPVDQQLFDQHPRRRQIVLFLRDHVSVGRLPQEALDVVSPRLIPVVQQRLAILRRRVQHRHGRAQHIADGIAQAPPAAFPRTAVEDLRSQLRAVLRELVHRVEVRRGVAIQRGFREERNAVAEDVREIQKSRVPVVEPGPVDRARHVVLVQIGRHVHAQNVQPARHQRMDVRRNGLHERRDEDARGERSRLVMAIEHHGVPFQFSARHLLRLQHVIHVAVAVVIVADVFLVKIGQRADLVGRADVLAVPRRHLVLPIRIQRRPQHQDHVVEDRVHLGVALRGNQFVRQRNRLLRARDFGGMQPAVQVHDGFAFPRQPVRLIVRESAGLRQPARNIFIPVQIRQVLRRRNHGDFPIQAARRLADVKQLYAIGRLCQLMKIRARFVVARQVEVVPRLVSENRFGGRNGLRENERR